MEDFVTATKGLILSAAAIVAIGAAAGGYWYFGQPGSAPAVATPASSAAISTPVATPGANTSVAQGLGPQIMPDDMVLGSPDAKVTIVEYASLTCSHCARFHRETMPKLKAEFIDTGKVKLVYRDFPFDEPSFRASMLARCAGKERFFGFIDALFQSQENWATPNGWKPGLARIAKLGGMSQETFDQCLANKAIEEPILAKRLEGTQKLGVESTPTFFINGEKVSGAFPYEHFAEIIKRKLPPS
jgi:protein-disulfide isomerase